MKKNEAWDIIAKEINRVENVEGFIFLGLVAARSSVILNAFTKRSEIRATKLLGDGIIAGHTSFCCWMR